MWPPSVSWLRRTTAAKASWLAESGQQKKLKKSDEGARAKRARQRELEFYERAIMDSDHQAKRKFPAADEEDLTKRVRGVGEESTTTFPSSSSSSTSHRVGAESTVTGGEQRGEKRAAEDPWIA